jgi:hypothetical protein
VTTQSSENEDTGMVPESVDVSPVSHSADNVNVTSDVGFAEGARRTVAVAVVVSLVIVSVNVRVSEASSVVPTATAAGRLDAVILSASRSLLTTRHVTVQPPPEAHATVPEMVLSQALADPATPTTAKPTARASVTTLDTARPPVR